MYPFQLDPPPRHSVAVPKSLDWSGICGIFEVFEMIPKWRNRGILFVKTVEEGQKKQVEGKFKEGNTTRLSGERLEH